MNRLIWWLKILRVVAVATLTPIAAQAKTPQVRFDFPHAVECQDVTAKEFARLYPHERLVEATFRVSTRIVKGHDYDLGELLVEIRSYSERMRVADFSPNTTLDTDLAGEIEIVETSETIGTRGLSVGVALPIPYGNVALRGSPSADIGRTQRDTRTETKKIVPPRRAIVSSGTIGNEHGVFFKVRPSRHMSLEDVHEFTVRFVVPQGWRGDWVQLACRAKPVKTGLSATTTAGEASVCLGLHVAGDQEARTAAYRVAHAQIRFLESEQHSRRGRLASACSWLAARMRVKVLTSLDAIGMENVADWLSASSRKEGAMSDDSPTIEFQNARDAMGMLGGSVRGN